MLMINSLGGTFMKKFMTLLFALFFLVPISIFANNIDVECKWINNDEKVSYFRYKLDDELEWTKVSSSVLSVEYKNLDSNVDHLFYLQQSYDGINWSASGIMVIESVVNQEVGEINSSINKESIDLNSFEDLKDEELPVAKFSEVVSEVQEMEEESFQKIVEEKVKLNSYYTSLSLVGGGIYCLNSSLNTTNSSNNKAVIAGIELGLNNLYSINENLGLGINFDVDYIMVPTEGLKNFALGLLQLNYKAEGNLRVAIAPEIEAQFSNIRLELIPFADVTLTNISKIGVANLTPNFMNNFVLGAGARISLAYDFGFFDIGLRAGGRYFADNWAIDATAFMGINF